MESLRRVTRLLSEKVVVGRGITRGCRFPHPWVRGGGGRDPIATQKKMSTTAVTVAQFNLLHAPHLSDLILTRTFPGISR